MVPLGTDKLNDTTGSPNQFDAGTRWPWLSLRYSYNYRSNSMIIRNVDANFSASNDCFSKRSSYQTASFFGSMGVQTQVLLSDTKMAF